MGVYSGILSCTCSLEMDPHPAPLAPTSPLQGEVRSSCTSAGHGEQAAIGDRRKRVLDGLYHWLSISAARVMRSLPLKGEWVGLGVYSGILNCTCSLEMDPHPPASPSTSLLQGEMKSSCVSR